MTARSTWGCGVRGALRQALPDSVHDISVWALREALMNAFCAGRPTAPR